MCSRFSIAPKTTKELIWSKRRSEFRKEGFLPGIRKNLIVMTIREESRLHVLHDYVHFLTRKQNALQNPAWFDEGVAAFFASTHVERDKVFVGDPPFLAILLSDRITIARGPALQWLPISKILTRDGYENWSREDKSMFFAEAWLAVHYLQLGRPDRVFLEDMGTYLAALHKGVPSLDAFEQGFGVDNKKFHSELRHYAKDARFEQRYRPDWPQPQLTIVDDLLRFTLQKEDFKLECETKTRRLEGPEIAIALAQALMRTGQEEASNRSIAYALEHDPTAAPAWAAKGYWLKLKGQYDEALPNFEKALKLAPNDRYVVLDIAEFWMDRAGSKDASPKQQSEWLHESRRYFARAWKLDNSIPEVYAMYGRTYLLDSTDPEKAVEMLSEASALLPSNLEIRLYLAQAHRRIGDDGKALELARSIEAWAQEGSSGGRHHDSHVGPSAAQMIADLSTPDATSGVDSGTAKESAPVGGVKELADIGRKEEKLPPLVAAVSSASLEQEQDRLQEAELVLLCRGSIWEYREGEWAKFSIEELVVLIDFGSGRVEINAIVGTLATFPDRYLVTFPAHNWHGAPARSGTFSVRRFTGKATMHSTFGNEERETFNGTCKKADQPLF